MPAGDIPIRVISLQRTPKRLAAFEQHNAHLPWSRHEAVDGERLSAEDVAASGLFTPAVAQSYTAGALGCAMSHRQLWLQAAEAGEPLTIAEDDAVFRGDFPAASQALLAQLPADWDFVLWGWNFDASLVVQLLPGVSPAALLFDQRRLRASLAEFQALRVPSLPLRLDKCFGIPAYTVSAAGARHLLRLCFPLTALTLRVPLIHSDVRNTGIDIAMNAAYPNLSAWACFPPLAVTPNEAERSTVQVSAALHTGA